LDNAGVRNVVTYAVKQELAGLGIDPLPAWIDEVVHVDELAELVVLGKWVNLMSSDTHNRGEATVLAWAEVHEAIAIVDDRAARRVAEREPVTVHGLLWVVCQCVCNGHIAEISASSFVDVMIDSGARYPFTRGGLVDWAKNEGLLP
jgi:predicted nucleic acid-binding protein